MPARSSHEIIEIGWTELIAAFLDEKERGGRPATRTVYGRLLHRFMGAVAKPLSEVTSLDIHRFAYGVGCPADEIPAGSTINLRLAAIGGFFAFARRMGCLEHDPAAELPRARVRPTRPRGLSMSEVSRLLAVIPSTPSGRRDRALILVALVTGLRRAELVAMTVHGMADDGSLLCAVQTKGGRQRLRRLPPSLLQSVADGARVDAGHPFTPGQRLFAMADSTFYAHVRRHAEAAGLSAVSPHALRHTAAKLRRQAGATIEEVSSLLGHSNIATTAIYLRRLEDEPDRGGEPVARALGRAGTRRGQEPGRNAEASERSPRARNRQGGWLDSRPVTWIGEHGHAELPNGDRILRRERRPARAR
jgi:site-specific recombinase XerD